MIFGSYDTPTTPPIPTFLQYLKTCNKGVESKTKFGIEIVWLPGKFDNVTLQTHAFRYICDPNHPLYALFIEFSKSEELQNSSKRIDITIDSIQDKKISISESSRVKGSWEKLGSNGLKFKET